MSFSSPRRLSLRALLALSAALVLLAACGGDSASGATGAGGHGGDGGASTSSTGAGGAGQGGGSNQGGSGGGGGSFVGIDPIAGTGPVELVQGGFSFTEGTVWLPALGVLRFSDIPQSRIHELDPLTDVITVWREPSGNTNGNGLAPGGDIVMCEHSGRRVSRSAAAGAPAPVLVADAYMGMAFNSPNDVIARSDGQLYLTDPTYGLAGMQEIPWQGVYRIDTGGLVQLVGDEYGQPNGIALSPDETLLYVSDSEQGGLYVYDVATDGSTGARALLFNAAPSDGMAVDVAGNLYLTTAAGVEVYQADGTPWGIIGVPQQPANCAFGGSDQRTLFITARTALYRIALNVPGLP